MKEMNRMTTRSHVHSMRILPAAVAALGLLILASCTTINRLGEFDIQGHTMAVQMRLPPEPKMEVSYTFDFSNALTAAFSIGSNIAKAANADRVDTLMRQALQVVDVPGMVRDESYSTCLTVLGTEQEEDAGRAEYLLDFDIHKWGVHASSWTTAVSLRMKLTVSLFENSERTIVWRRDIEVKSNATPAMFGLSSTLGNFVTTAALASLSEEDLQNGFDELARQTALEVSRALQNDLYDTRYED